MNPSSPLSISALLCPSFRQSAIPIHSLSPKAITVPLTHSLTHSLTPSLSTSPPPHPSTSPPNASPPHTLHTRHSSDAPYRLRASATATATASLDPDNETAATSRPCRGDSSAPQFGRRCMEQHRGRFRADIQGDGQLQIHAGRELRRMLMLKDG